MTCCDVLIVGGGPGGSSCAWGLRRSGLDVAVLDKQFFPRDKVCGGWITPAVVEELEIDLADYARGRVLQQITEFRVGVIDGPSVEIGYGAPVSYGIRRREFDEYLLRRSGARLMLGSPLTSLVRSGDGWIANDQIHARVIVGAGGHFCPVARITGAKVSGEPAVVAQEAEFEMSAEQAERCRVKAETPELYFCPDLKGYGWCFRKGSLLNVGLGRADSHRLSSHAARFLEFLKSSGRISFEIPALKGHAYLLHGTSPRRTVADGVMLIGDAAGLAYPFSGEGIRPAVESGLLAARAIVDAGGKYTQEQLSGYRSRIAARPSHQMWTTRIGRLVPSGWISSAARRLVAQGWFARNVVLNKWFLGPSPFMTR